MTKKLFPYILQLQIFQLEEYNIPKFWQWVLSHYFVREIENKKPLIWTKKAKALYYLSILLCILTFIILTYFWGLIGALLGFLLATKAYIYLSLAYYLLLPLESYKKAQIKSATKEKLASFSNVTVIGITGSYGKTSVKEFLYQILRTKYPVLKTPESYNTPYGIAKVVDLELDDSYKYFICEMGAYRVGDIKEICEMVHPKHGILTGINEQHLDTFGSIENTTKGKFELLDSLPPDGLGIANGDNERIKKHIATYPKKVTLYGESDEKFAIQEVKQTPEGTHFSLILNDKKYKAQTELLGNPNLQNILAAATMSFLLGLEPQAIIDAIKKIHPVPHRLEIKRGEKMTIIDDAYNSNVDGFKQANKLLQSFKQPKVFVTPGIVNLGNKTFSIHKELGTQLNNIDYIFLIGKSERTNGLYEGINDKNNVVRLSSLKDVWPKLEELKLNNPVVLLENDLPDNY